jgi:hypothetical protein
MSMQLCSGVCLRQTELQKPTIQSDAAEGCQCLRGYMDVRRRAERWLPVKGTGTLRGRGAQR